MQNRRLLFEDESGYLRIVIPSKDYKMPKEHEMEAIGRLFAQCVIPDVVHFIVCREQHIPKDLTFRDAWRLGDQKCPVKIDLASALAIHRQRIKRAAEALIFDLNRDLECAKASCNLPLQIAIEKTKIILKTIHEANMTHCKGVEDIKAFIPQELMPYWSKVCEN